MSDPTPALMAFLRARVAEIKANPTCPGSGEYSDCDARSAILEGLADAVLEIVEEFEDADRERKRFRRTDYGSAQRTKRDHFAYMACVCAKTWSSHPDYDTEGWES